MHLNQWWAILVFLWPSVVKEITIWKIHPPLVLLKCNWDNVSYNDTLAVIKCLHKQNRSRVDSVPVFLTLQYIFPITKKALYIKNQISLFTMCINLLHTQHIMHHINILYIIEIHYVSYTLNSTSTRYHYISHTIFQKYIIHHSCTLCNNTVYHTHNYQHI